jgi:hypothetical protein
MRFSASISMHADRATQLGLGSSTYLRIVRKLLRYCEAYGLTIQVSINEGVS